MKTRLREGQHLIVHVGLGKTGTTTLQSHVFPKLSDAGIAAFNPGDTQQVFNRLAACSDYTSTDSQFDFTDVTEDTILLSDERLIGWNPGFWTERCRQIEEMFGASATILLTVRDPESYLRSMYQQQIHQGNISKPQEFLLPEDEFRAYENITRVRLNEICNVDAMDIEALTEALAARFARVVVVPFPDLLDLRFLPDLIDISAEDLAGLQEDIVRLPRKNQSYSNLAMRLTLLRERILNVLGLKSLGTHDRYRNLAQAEAIETGRGLKKLLRPMFTWRGLMQITLPKLTGYKPYRLPPNVYRGVCYDHNVVFFERLKAQRMMDLRSDSNQSALKEGAGMDY